MWSGGVWLSRLSGLVVALVACDGEAPRESSLIENRADTTTTSDGVADTMAPDTTRADTQLPDTLVADTQVADTARPDTTADTTPADTQVADTQVADTTPADTQVADTTPADTTPADTSPPGDTGPVLPDGPIDINTNFIGGACTGDTQCAYASGDCKPAAEGYPAGMCTQGCTQFCPDQAGLATTFCIDGAVLDETGGMCVSKCDLNRSPTGCRDGYTCADELRFNQETVASWVCLPGEWTGCLQELILRGVEFTMPASTTMDRPDALPSAICDVFEPIRVSGVINGVNFRPSNFTNAPAAMYVQCGVALKLWDMAELGKARGITDYVHYGTYNCRTIAGTNSLSQHAYANAIDIAGVQTSGGQRYTVLSHWEDGVSNPTTPGGQLLYWLAHTMHDQRTWNIILTPEYNAAHNDHFHVDLTPGSWYLSE